MKKNLLLVFYFLFFVLLTKDGFCQNPLVKEWDYRFGGSDADVLNSIQPTNDGGSILGGVSLSAMNGDKTQPNWGSGDYWLIKTNSLGIKQWDKDFGGTASDRLYAVQQTEDGGYILGGYSASGISGDKTEANRDTSCPFCTNDYWIVKIDSLGIKQWDKTFGGTSDDQLTSIKQTADGGYILGGISVSDSSGDKTQPVWDTCGFCIPMGDYWIVKTDSLGNKQWDKDFGGVDGDILTSLDQAADGGFILGGYSASGISGDKTQPVWGAYDYWILKTDANGNKLWDKDFVGTDADWLYSLCATADGGFILGGVSFSGIGGDKTQACWGWQDYWIIKTDSLGNKLWDKDFGGTDEEDDVGTISQTADGGYLIAGTSYSNISGDKTETNLSDEQIWAVKTDSLGIKQWDKTLKTDYHEEAGYAVQTKDGCYLMANGTYAGIGGDKTQATQGVCDYWIIKFCDTTLTTSISNIQPLTSNFTIFPNPANGFITVSFTQGGEKNVSVEVYDLVGTPLPLTPEGELRLSKSGNVKLNISNFIPGVYIVEIKTGNDCYRKKIIKM